MKETSPFDKSSSLSFWFFLGLVSVGFGTWLEMGGIKTGLLLSEEVQTEENRPDPITATVVGDIMFSRFYNQPIRDYFNTITSDLPVVFQATDLLVGNLEGVVAPPASPAVPYDFAFKDDYATQLADYGFDAVSLANNHAHDQGTAGYERTKTKLAEVGVGYFGHQFFEDSDIHYKTINDQTLAFLGFNLTNRELDDELVRRTINTAVANSDYQLVMMHWGEEYQHEPTAEQVNFGRKLVDWGADAVVGAHPHVLQGMEIYNNAPILWSLGNFIFDQQFSQAVREGVIAELTFSADSTEVSVWPYQIVDYIPTKSTSTRERQLQEFFAWSNFPENIKYLNDQTILIAR